VFMTTPDFAYLSSTSSVKARYASASINPSSSAVSVTLIFASHPSPSGLLLIVPGFSSSTLLTSIMVPPTGVMMSEADFTDSTAPIASPLLTSVSTVGSST